MQFVSLLSSHFLFLDSGWGVGCDAIKDSPNTGPVVKDMLVKDIFGLYSLAMMMVLRVLSFLRCLLKIILKED